MGVLESDEEPEEEEDEEESDEIGRAERTPALEVTSHM